MDNKEYNMRRYNRKKQYYRLTLGFQQLLNYPLLNLSWIILIAGVVACLYAERRIMLFYESQTILRQIMMAVMQLLNVIIPIILVLGIIDFIGEIAARKDEDDICLVFGDKRDVTKQPPILIKKKYDKKYQITQREFYTSIAMERWKEKREAICDRLDIHLIGDFSYGGKKKNRGNRIYFEAAKGRKPLERGVLYDDFF